MLIAWAFICALTATDCEREATSRIIVGQGATPAGCLLDGQQGAAAFGLTAGEGERVVIACRHKVSSHFHDQ